MATRVKRKAAQEMERSARRTALRVVPKTKANRGDNGMEGLLGYGEVSRASMTAAVAGEHVLILGKPGTAKSDFFKLFFGMFEDAKSWHIQLSKQMDESHIFGIPNIDKLMRGEVEYPDNAPILNADFVGFDEMFDSSDVLLRSLNECLNERTFSRGNKSRKLRLRTAIATANYTRVNEVTEAVIDRFVIAVNAPHLTPKDRAHFYNGFKLGTAKVKLTLAKLDEIRDKAVEVTIPVHVVEALLDMSAKHNFSYRREYKLAKLLRTYAAIHNKQVVDAEGLEPFKWALPIGMKEAERDSVLRDLVKLTANNSVAKDQHKLLKQLEALIAAECVEETAKKLHEVYARGAFANQEVREKFDALYRKAAERWGENFDKAWLQA